MPRSIMTPDGLVFVEDLNVENVALQTAQIINRDGIYYTADIGYSGPRTIIRTQPTIQSDVNNDPDLRRRVVKYFYEKFEVWLYGSFKDLGNYFSDNNGNITAKQSSDGMTPNKAKFILKEVITKSTILKILDKYVRRRNVNWFDLKTKHYDSVKDYIRTKVKSHVKKL